MTDKTEPYDKSFANDAEALEHPRYYQMWISSEDVRRLMNGESIKLPMGNGNHLISEIHPVTPPSPPTDLADPQGG